MKKKENAFLKIFNRWWPLPLQNKNVFLLIFLQLVWTAVVVWLVQENYVESDVFDTTTMFEVLTGTLGFILPLQLNTAIRKNRESLKFFNALCAEVLALAWECVALVEEEEVQKSSLQHLFDLLVALPAVVKHSYRGTFELCRVTGLDNVVLVQKNMEIINAKNSDMEEVDFLFMKVIDYANDYAKSDKNLERELLKKWSSIYSSYGALGSLCAYKSPEIFKNVLNTALLFWSIILPFSVAKNGWWSLLTVFVISYFFLGLNLSGQKIGNAFAENVTGFGTVTKKERATTRALRDVWRNKVAVAKTIKITI